MITTDIDKIFQSYSAHVDADIDIIDEYTVAHSRVKNSDDLILMVPGGTGQICISDENNITDESLLLPANILQKFVDRNVSSCIFNCNVELPVRYSPLLPLTDDHDDVIVEEYYRQIKTIIEYYSKEYRRVWYLGHSNSATVAIGMSKWWQEFDQSLAGLILINPKKVFKRPNKEYIPHFGKWLHIPVLAISHARDGSQNCPADFNRMLSKCSKDPKSKHIMFDGGIPDGDNDPNLGFGYHGLRGLEDALVNEIVDFIEVPVVDR